MFCNFFESYSSFNDYSIRGYKNVITNGIHNCSMNNTNYLEQCSTSNVINNHSGSEALTLNIDPSLIASAITTPGSPRIGLISATNNHLIYRLYAGIVNTTSLCGGTTPAILEEWIANDGVAGVSGIVEVTTESNGIGFLHKIHLKGVTLKKGTSDFYLADDYYLGDLLTN